MANGALGLGVSIFQVGQEDLNMSKDSVNEDNYISVDKDKLKEEQKAELKKAQEAYEQECLKTFSATRAGEVIKKFDFPTLQPLTEVQRENKMLDMVH